jgi:hypothetical protein
MLLSFEQSRSDREIAASAAQAGPGVDAQEFKALRPADPRSRQQLAFAAQCAFWAQKVASAAIARAYPGTPKPAITARAAGEIYE